MSEVIPPKYPHPKILLIDMKPEVATELKKEGYNISSGTFGTPYKVKKSSNYEPVIAKASLPNYTEQEILILDLVPDDPMSGPPAEKMSPSKELDWWAKCNLGEIDPRPRVMAMVSKQFERIFNNGGAFIVFSDARIHQKLIHARETYSGLLTERNLEFDNWSFLSILSNLIISDDHGEEIRSVNQEWPLVKLLSDYLDDAIFCCTFQANWNIEKRWGILAKNKYGATVAGVIFPSEKTKEGWIFILPRIKKKALFLSAFLKNILPDLCPKLFPYVEGQKWVYRSEYELPSVLTKAKQISAIQDDAAKKITELEASIEDDRNASQFLYSLIRETGDPLVKAIEKALGILGFKSVIDVDAEMKKVGKEASLREDLRIHDQSPILVVDIKGVAGKPADAEALQAQKHAFIFIKEQKRHDVQGLTIINHQRLLPPLERDNDMPFRKEILDNAEQVQLGLMTGWDLFRLVRNFIQNKWKSEQVIPLFYKTGRILPIPCHYEYIGKVEQVWKSAFSIEIEQGKICAGDNIAIEFPVDFNEQPVKSLRLDDIDVKEVAAGSKVGVLREESLPKVKAGMSVYRIA